MKNLETQKGNRSSRGRKYIKEPVCSFNKFQDFLVAKSKQKTPKAFFMDRPSMTGQIKIQKLNFNKTTSDSQFLPPKSIDKFSRSSTNRNGFTVPKQQLLMSQTQTPIQKSKIWSFESTNEEYLPRPQEIKAKIESNAMQRFQQLFKKQTNIRAKRIEEQQSKRLMRLLENTTRKHQVNQNSNRNFQEPQIGYVNYGNGSKKKLNQQQNHLNESTNLQRQYEDQNDSKMRQKQSILNPKMSTLSQKNKTIDRESQCSQTQKSTKVKQSQNKNFFKQRVSIDLGKQLKKKTIDIDGSIRNTQISKQNIQNIKKSIKKTQSIEADIDPKAIQKVRGKFEEDIRKSQQKGQVRKSEVRENKKEQLRESQKNRIKEEEKNKQSLKTIEHIQAQKKPSLQATKSNEEQKQPKQTAIPQTKQPVQKQQANEIKPKQLENVKKQTPRQQYAKKNSFNIEQMDPLDLLPTAEIVEKLEPSIKQMGNDKQKFTQNNLKDQQKKEQDTKGKVSLEEIIKNKVNERQKTQQSIGTQNNTKPKTPITIKGAKQVKSTKNQPNPTQTNQRYQTNQDDIDDLQEVSIISKGAKKDEENKRLEQMNKSNNQANKSIGQNGNPKGTNQKDAMKSVSQVSNKNIKPSTQTSLANELENNKGEIQKAQHQKPQLAVSNTQKPQPAVSNTQKPQPAVSNTQKPQPTNNNTQNRSQPTQPTTAHPNQNPPSQQKVQFNDSQVQSSPADQLGYLLDLVQTLGSYYTDSKHFYSQPDSSMIQILMNHKLSSYFLAQQYYFYISLFKKCAEASQKDEFYSLSPQEFEEALQDQQMYEGIEQLKKSAQLAVKLIKMTFQRCKMYLKKHQKQLTISPELNYHKQSIEYLRAQFSSLYALYLDKTTTPLGKRLCYLIQTYCLVMYLNQEELKEYEDVEDIEPHLYTKHINRYKHLLGM